MQTSPGLEAWANIEAEQNLISCMLTDKESIGFCVTALEPNDFYDTTARFIFKTIKKLWDSNKSIDMISVTAEGHDMAQIAEYMLNIVPQGYRNHANIVKTLSVKRQGISAAKTIIQELPQKRFENPQEVTHYITGKLDQSLPKLEQTPEDTQTIALEVMDYMENVATGKIKPILYGIRDIDYFTGGLWSAELTILAAGPSTGKTAFALDIAGNAARNGTKVEFFSLEMNRIQVGSRLFAQTRLLNAGTMRNPIKAWEQGRQLAEASSAVAKLPITIDQTTKTIQELKNKCERKKEMNQLDLVIIDYLQLLESSTRHDSRRHEVEYISRQLKLMSRDLNIPVMVLSQLNREGQKSVRPRLWDLRETGAIEQDADNVMFLYNPKTDETINDILVELEVIIAKQRSGRTGKTALKFNKNHMKFYGMEM